MVRAGLDAEGPEGLSVVRDMKAAGPGSGLSRPMLCITAQMRLLCACSVVCVARRKWSHRSLNSVDDNSPAVCQ